MTDLRLYNRAFLREFIHLYHEHQVLWDKKSEHYLSESARFTAYADLQEKLLEVDKNATIETVRTKINSLRTNFRHELRKLEAAEKSDKKYIPRLWYFYDMAFLTDKKLPDAIFEKKMIEEHIKRDTRDLRLCSKEFVKDFIKLYRRNECLWKINSENYTNKRVRLKALENLRLLYLKIDKSVTINNVKSKINSLRTNFRHELRKVQAAESNGTVYKSNLYYFNEMMFLIDQDLDNKSEKNSCGSTSLRNSDFKEFENLQVNFNRFCKPSSQNDNEEEYVEEKEEDLIEEIEEQLESNICIERYEYDSHSNYNDKSLKNFYEFENVHVEDLDDLDSQSEDDNIRENISPAPKQNQDKEMNFSKIFEQNETIIKNDLRNINNNDENINTYAKFVVCELKMLPADDIIFVKKIINDVLFEAKLGNAKRLKLISNTKLQRSIHK